MIYIGFRYRYGYGYRVIWILLVLFCICIFMCMMFNPIDGFSYYYHKYPSPLEYIIITVKTMGN